MMIIEISVAIAVLIFAILAFFIVKTLFTLQHTSEKSRLPVRRFGDEIPTIRCTSPEPLQRGRDLRKRERSLKESLF